MKNTIGVTEGKSLKLKYRIPWIPGLRKPIIVLRKPKVPKPKEIPTNLILGVILCYLFFIFAGGIYNIVTEDVLSLGVDAFGRPVLIDERLDNQFIIEGIVAAIFIFLGFLGFILIYYSSRYMLKPRYATMMLLTGIALVIVGFIGAEYMLDPKVPTLRE